MERVLKIETFAKARKKEVVQMLSKRTGLFGSTISVFVQAWADTSCVSYVSMLIQQRASKMFGTKLSSWQKEKRRQLNKARAQDFSRCITPFEDSEGVLLKSVFGLGYKSNAGATDACLNAMYEATQEDFKKAGVTHIQAFRGVGNEKGISIKTLGNKIQSKNVSVLESWSTDIDMADLFAMDNSGNVFVTNIPVSRVLSSPKTGFGCSNASELVVFGNMDDASVHIITEGRVFLGQNIKTTDWNEINVDWIKHIVMGKYRREELRIHAHLAREYAKEEKKRKPSKWDGLVGQSRNQEVLIADVKGVVENMGSVWAMNFVGDYVRSTYPGSPSAKLFEEAAVEDPTYVAFELRQLAKDLEKGSIMRMLLLRLARICAKCELVAMLVDGRK